MTPMNPQAPLLIWGSMGSTHLLLVFVALQTMPATGEQPDLARALVPAAIVMATLSILLGFRALIPTLLGLTRSIVRWAFAETATILGLLAVTFSAQPLYLYACAAFGLLAWAAAFPTAASLQVGEPPGRGEG